MVALGDTVRLKAYTKDNVEIESPTFGKVFRIVEGIYHVKYLTKPDSENVDIGKSRVALRMANDLTVLSNESEETAMINTYISMRTAKLLQETNGILPELFNAEDRQKLKELHELAGTKMNSTLRERLIDSLKD